MIKPLKKKKENLTPKVNLQLLGLLELLKLFISHGSNFSDTTNLNFLRIK